MTPRRSARLLSHLTMLALLASCSSATQIRLGSGGARSAPPPGTSVSGAEVAIDIRSGSALAAIAAAAALGIVLNRDQPVLEDRPEAIFPRLPAMDERRAVNVQDCTRPIERTGANLMCR